MKENQSQKVEEKPRMSMRQRIVLGVLSACCVALIAVCGIALATSDDASPSNAVLASGSASITAAQQAEAGGAEESTEEDAAEETAGSQDTSTSDASSDGSSASNDSDRDTSSDAANTDGGGDTPSNAGNGDADTSNNQQQTITVSVVVDSSAADGSVSGSGTFTFKEGATPYDALCALRSDVTSSSTAMGIYVEGIGGLIENDSRYPGVSGWKYMVNGRVVMQSAGSYTLSDGDHVTWYYTVTG